MGDTRHSPYGEKLTELAAGTVNSMLSASVTSIFGVVELFWVAS